MAYSDGRDGKGSRDPFVENWQQYGQRALSEYLLKNYTDYDNRDPYLNYGSYSSVRGSDPLGIIQDPARLSAFFDPITARYDELAMRSLAGLDGLNYGVETEPNRTFNPTKDEVQRFIDRQYADAMAAGNPGNDAMWLPRLEGENVITGLRNSKGGFLDKITPIAENAMALSGFAGPALGASIAGGALAESGAALADIALGGQGGSLGAAGLGGATTALAPAAGGGVLSGLTDLVNSIPNPFTPSAGAATTPSLGALEAAGGIPELGLVANPATANAAIAGGIPASTLAGGAGALGLGTIANAAGNAASAGSAIDRILNGSATAGDWASILGTVGSTALGVYGANQQSNALTDIANQARADRQPFLNKSLEWLNNPQSYQDGPGKSSLDAVLRGLSVQGNPFGSPTNMALAGDIANKNWQNAVTGFGNIGLAGQDSRSQLLSNAATADRGVTASLASGLGSLTQDNSLEGILRKLQGSGFNLTGLT